MRAPLTGHANIAAGFLGHRCRFSWRYLGAFIHHFRQGLLNHLLACPLLRDDLAVLFGYDVIHGFDAIPPGTNDLSFPQRKLALLRTIVSGLLGASPTPSPPFLPSAVLPVSLPALGPDLNVFLLQPGFSAMTSADFMPKSRN